MGRRSSSNPLERRSMQLMLVIAAIALFANSAVDRTDDGLPWEVTLGGLVLFAVIFAAMAAEKTEVALSVCWYATVPAICTTL